jgi:hypothetical protein
MKYVLCNLCGWSWFKVEEIFEDDCPICPDSPWGFTYNSDEKIPGEVEKLTF